MNWDWAYTFEILPQMAAASLVTLQATIFGFALAAVLGGSALEASVALERAGIAPTARGEELTAEQFLRIARATSSDPR